MKSGILGGDTLVEIIATSPLWHNNNNNNINSTSTINNDGSNKMEQVIDKVIFLTDVDGVYTKDPNLFPEEAKLLRTIDIDPSTGEIDSVEMQGEKGDLVGNGKRTLATDVGTLEVIGSSHAHDVTGGLKAKLGSAAVVAKTGIDVKIVRCCSKTAEQTIQELHDSDIDLGTTITRKKRKS